jgi:hypothetical protein
LSRKGIRNALLESDGHECPTCHEMNVSPDQLIPNRNLRAAVLKFRSDTGYHKDHHKYVPFSVNGVAPTPRPPIDAKPDNKPEVKAIDTKVSEDVLQSNDKLEVDSKEVDSEGQSPQQSLSPKFESEPIVENSATDVTMDEVILGSPKIAFDLGLDTKSPDNRSSILGKNELISQTNDNLTEE